MQIKQLNDDISVTGQITPEEVALLSRAGFKSVICNRPDDEDPGQPSFASIAAAAEANGMQARHIPVSAELTPDMQKDAFAQAMAEMPGPVLAYCRTGNRSGMTYTAACQ